MHKSLIIGGAMVDVLLYLPHLPLSGGDIVANGGHHIMGGCAMNVAQVLQHFACPFDLCVPIGVGSNAHFIQKELSKEGWHTLIHSTKADNGVCYTLIEPSGERSFITVPGIEQHFQVEWFEGIDPTPYAQLYLGGYECVSPNGDIIVEWLHRLAGKQLFFCPGPVLGDIAPHRFEAICALHPIMHLNISELYAWAQMTHTEQAMQELALRTKAPVIVTAGPDGAFLYDLNSFSHIPTTPQLVVDTSGAGDAHIGTIMAELAQGHNLLSAISQANEISGFVVQHAGPRPLSQSTIGVIL